MNMLFSCYSGKSTKGYDHTWLRAACHRKMVFFCDASFNSQDLNFLFRDIIVVYPLIDLSPDHTGHTLVQGKLSSHFSPEDNRKIRAYLDSSRLEFVTQLNILHAWMDVNRKVAILLGLPSNFSFENASEIVYPNIQEISPLESDLLEIAYHNNTAMTAFEQGYLYDYEISKWFIDYVKYVRKQNMFSFFAGYAFLGQSSCMGKSRLLNIPLETEDVRFF